MPPVVPSFVRSLRAPQRVATRWLLVGALVGLTASGLAACGGGGDGPVGTDAPVPTSVSLGAPSLTITSVGGTSTLTASVRDASGTVIPGASLTWTSDTPAVATVTGSGATGTVNARGRGVAVITARAGGLTASVTVFVRAAFSVGIAPAATTLRVGQTATLAATVGADDEASRAVRWSSSNGTVASISSQGLVSAVSPGTTTITARAESDTSVRAEALVTVVPARSVLITPADIQVGRDESRTLTAQLFLDPNESTAVTWRTNRPLIASVTQQGVVTGVSDGEATITLIAQADTTLRATARVRVVPIVRNLTIAPTTATLNIGQTRTFVASATIDQGANGALSWSTDNGAIASVNGQGVVTAIGVGTTLVRVRSVADTTREATATLTVAPRPVTLTLGTRTLGLLRGAQTTLSAVVSADPGVSTAVRWTSRNGSVATVDGTGRVTAVDAGATWLLAEAVADDSKRDSVQVTVVPQLAASWLPDRLGGPLIEDIVSLWAPSTSLAWAVNSLGDVYRWDGTTWTRSATGAQFGTTFAAVHGVAADAVTAVGSGGVIAQYNGTSWSTVPSGTQSALTDVWMHARDTAWAVGANGTALYRAGASWTVTPSNTTATLRAVSGSGREAFAVGDGGVVRRYQSGAWLTVATPSGETLRDVWAGAGLAGDVVIVGDFGTLLRWQGDALVADPAAGGANLFAVEVSPTAGRSVIAGDGIALARTNGAWQELAVPYRTRFTAVAANTDGLWIGGQRGLVMRSNWNIASWNTLSLTPDLLDVWSTSATHAIAVGELGFIFRYDGAAWTRQLAPTLERLNTVWAASSTLAFAGGDNGALLRWDGTSWVAQASPTSEHVYAMWGAGADAVWAVTQGGEVLLWDGTEWAVVHQQAQPLYGVYGTSAGDVHAVGLDGTALHFDGTAWSTRATGTNHVLVGLWAGAGERAVTVGARNFTSGVALRFDGDAWQELPAGTSQILSAVWGAIEWDLYAVGDAGTVLRYNGTGWSPMNSGTQEFLWAIAGAPGANGGGFAVGLNGTVLQGQGSGSVASARVGASRSRRTSLEPAPRVRPAKAAVLRRGTARERRTIGR